MVHGSQESHLQRKHTRAGKAASGERSQRAARVLHSSTCDTNHMKGARRSLPSKLPKQADTGQEGAAVMIRVTHCRYSGGRGMSELSVCKQTENHSVALNSKSNFLPPKARVIFVFFYLLMSELHCNSSVFGSWLGVPSRA